MNDEMVIHEVDKELKVPKLEPLIQDGGYKLYSPNPQEIIINKISPRRIKRPWYEMLDLK